MKEELEALLLGENHALTFCVTGAEEDNTEAKASDRAKFRRKPAHILLTTPESLAITLCQLPYQRAFSTCHFVVVDVESA